MKKIGKIFFPVFRWICVVMLLVPLAILGQGSGDGPSIAVRSSISSPTVRPGSSVRLSVTVIADRSVDVTEPSVGNIPGFRISFGGQIQGSSTTLQVVEDSSGRRRMEPVTKKTVEFQYDLEAQEEGTFQIPKFRVSVNGKAYETAPFKVTVTAAAPPSRPSSPFDEEDSSPFAQQFQQLLRNRGMLGPQGLDDEPEEDSQFAPGSGGVHREPSIPPSVNGKELYFVHLDLDKKTAYEGEQVTATWYLYTRATITNLDRVKFPDLKGFWKEVIEEVPALNFSQTVINGVVYRKALLASHALFPIKPGTAVIDEYKLKATIVPVNNFGFGFGQSLNLTRASDRVRIQVKPLPREGRPPHFSGAVGDFKVSTSLGSQQFAVNQPFAWKIRFEGRGNAKLIELPPLEFPPGLELYDKKEDSKFAKDGTSYKEFEVLVIPRVAGAVKIPSFEFAQFNPKLEKYMSQKVPEQEIQVQSGGVGTNPNSSSPVAGLGAAALQGSDSTAKLGPRLPALQLTLGSTRDFSANMWVGVLGFVLLVLALSWKWYSESRGSDRNQEVFKSFEERSSRFSSLLKSGNSQKAAVEWVNMLQFVLDQFSDEISASELSLDQKWKSLPVKLRNQYESKLNAVYDLAQNLAFAPQALRESLGSDKQNLQELKKGVQLLKEILKESATV